MTQGPIRTVDGFEHGHVIANDVRLHFVRGGTGAPLLLLHGWPQTWWEWRHMMPALTERFSIVALDLRGFGDSERPPAEVRYAEVRYDVATLCADIAALLDRLGFDTIRLVGHDLGGLVSYAFARLHGQRVEKLALADAPLPLYGLEVPGWDAVEKQLWYQRFHRVPYLPEAPIAGRERVYLSWHFSSACNPAAITPDDIDEYVRCIRRSAAFGRLHLRSRGRSLGRTGQGGGIRPDDNPAALLRRAASMGGLFAESLGRIATDAQLCVVPDSGHWMPEENPRFMAERLLAFL